MTAFKNKKHLVRPHIAETRRYRPQGQRTEASEILGALQAHPAEANDRHRSRQEDDGHVRRRGRGAPPGDAAPDNEGPPGDGPPGDGPGSGAAPHDDAPGDGAPGDVSGDDDGAADDASPRDEGSAGDASVGKDDTPPRQDRSEADTDASLDTDPDENAATAPKVVTRNERARPRLVQACLNRALVAQHVLGGERGPERFGARHLARVEFERRRDARLSRAAGNGDTQDSSDTVAAAQPTETHRFRNTTTQGRTSPSRLRKTISTVVTVPKAEPSPTLRRSPRASVKRKSRDEDSEEVAVPGESSKRTRPPV